MFTKIKEYTKTCLERQLKHIGPDQPATSGKSRLDLNCLTRYICHNIQGKNSKIFFNIGISLMLFNEISKIENVIHCMSLVKKCDNITLIFTIFITFSSNLIPCSTLPIFEESNPY